MNRPIQMYLVKICEEISAKIWEVLLIKSSEIRYIDISVDNSMYNMIDFICLYLSNSILWLGLVVVERIIIGILIGHIGIVGICYASKWLI
jgi:hypothetical protein